MPDEMIYPENEGAGAEGSDNQKRIGRKEKKEENRKEIKFVL